MKPKLRFYPLMLAPLILMLGFIWVMGGTLNMYDVNFAQGPTSGNERYSYLIGDVWSQGGWYNVSYSTLYLPNHIGPNPVPGMSWFLENVMAPNAGAVMTTMAVFELLIGISIFTGAFTKISLVGAPLMNFGIILAAGHTNPGILRVNLLMLASALALLIYRRQNAWGLDPWLAKKLRNVPLLNRIASTPAKETPASNSA
ncbi:MAG: hypothetical protein LUO85_00985 [Methanomassiliicoccales archaeon]|nr:hypothetical protein [Methanomassiliicoccales archaeon]